MNNVLIKTGIALLFVSFSSADIYSNRRIRALEPGIPSEHVIFSDDLPINISRRYKRGSDALQPRELNMSVAEQGAQSGSSALKVSDRRTTFHISGKNNKATEKFRPVRRQKITNISGSALLTAEEISDIKRNKKTLVRQNKTLRSISRNVYKRRFVSNSKKSRGGELSSAQGAWWQYFFDDFESLYPNYWQLYGTPTWGQTSYRASTGTNSIWCAGWDYPAGGNYYDNMDGWIVDGPFTLAAASDALLYFDYRVNSEPVNDAIFVGVSTDGIDFLGNSYSGDSGGWIQNEFIDISNYVGSTSIYVGVDFYSNGSDSNYEGGYLDNIELAAYELAGTNSDLAVQNVQITDPYNGIFNFDISNAAVQAQAADSYTISVYVDNEFDSSARNSYPIGGGGTVTWDWQLAYYYLPGIHTVKIDVEPDGGDVNPGDNILTFSLSITNADVINLGVYNPIVVDAAQGYFDFDIDNFGPATALSNSYQITVEVDDEFDSSERNNFPLMPTQQTTWEWATGYLYPAGSHKVDITVTSDITDTNPSNDSISFTMTVPSGTVVTDLKVSNLKIKDEKNALFKFNVKNKGPATCDKGDYLIRVFVDGLEDSSAANTLKLTTGMVAVWDWQLAYIYSPGLHLITIEVKPSGGDLKPDDNTLNFQMLENGIDLQTLAPPVFTTVVSSAFSVMLSATNGAPPYTWQKTNGSLPQGIYLAGNGRIAGKGTTAGSYSFKAKCTDAGGASAFTDVSIVVLDTAPSDKPRIINTVLPVVFANTYFEIQLDAVGGTTPYAWSSTGGMPSGTSLSSGGLISGTITSAGEYLLNIRVTDDALKSYDTALNLRVLKSGQFLNCQFQKIKITIPWQLHSSGSDNSDSIKLKAICPMPNDFALDKYSRLIVFIGDYPFSFNKPKNAKTTKKASFISDKGVEPKGKAIVKRTSTGSLKISLSMKHADLALALEEFGVKENGPSKVTIPFRVALNNCDTGIREEELSYTLSGSRKGKLKK